MYCVANWYTFTGCYLKNTAFLFFRWSTTSIFTCFQTLFMREWFVIYSLAFSCRLRSSSQIRLFEYQIVFFLLFSSKCKLVLGYFVLFFWNFFVIAQCVSLNELSITAYVYPQKYVLQLSPFVSAARVHFVSRSVLRIYETVWVSHF